MSLKKAGFAKLQTPPCKDFQQGIALAVLARPGVPAMADMFKSPRAVIEGVTMWARFPMPIRIGPTSSPPPLTFSVLRTALAASALAKTSDVGRTVEARRRGTGGSRTSGIKGSIHMHFALIGKIARGRLSRMSSAPRARATAVSAVVTELRIRAHRNLRFDPEAAHMTRSRTHRFGDLFRALGVLCTWVSAMNSGPSCRIIRLSAPTGCSSSIAQDLLDIV